MNQARRDLLRLVLFADALGLLDEILDFDETSRDENVAPSQTIRPESSIESRGSCYLLNLKVQCDVFRTSWAKNNAVRAKSLTVLVISPTPRIYLSPPLKDTNSVVETSASQNS